jgi:hypothetical protein
MEEALIEKIRLGGHEWLNQVELKAIRPNTQLKSRILPLISSMAVFSLKSFRQNGYEVFSDFFAPADQHKCLNTSRFAGRRLSNSTRFWLVLGGEFSRGMFT